VSFAVAKHYFFITTHTRTLIEVELCDFVAKNSPKDMASLLDSFAAAGQKGWGLVDWDGGGFFDPVERNPSKYLSDRGKT